MHLVSVRRKSDADSPSHCLSKNFEKLVFEEGEELALDGWFGVLCYEDTMRVVTEGVHQGVSGLQKSIE